MLLLPLCSSVALALYPYHVDPEQAVQRLQSHTSHFGVFILHIHTHTQQVMLHQLNYSTHLH